LVARLGSFMKSKKTGVKSPREEISDLVANSTGMDNYRRLFIKLTSEVLVPKYAGHIMPMSFGVMEGEAVDAMVLMNKGKLTRSEVDSKILQQIDNRELMIEDRESRIAKVAVQSAEFFDVPKWFVGVLPGHGYIAGKFDCPLYALSAVKYARGLPDEDVPFTIVEPMQFLPTLDDLPAPWDQIKPTLVMAKVGREGESVATSPENDLLLSERAYLQTGMCVAGISTQIYWTVVDA
jgi:hypothetical protein